MCINDLSRDADSCAVDDTSDGSPGLLSPLSRFVDSILDLRDLEDVDLEVLNM